MNLFINIIVLYFIISFVMVKTNGQLLGFRIEKYSNIHSLKLNEDLIPSLREDDTATLRLVGSVASYIAFALTEHTSSCNFLIKNSEFAVKQNGESTALTEIRIPNSLRYEARVFFCMNDGQSWQHQGNHKHLSFIIYENIIPDWVIAVTLPVTVLVSALCSGLTVGLLSLDVTELKILSKAGTAKQQETARKILPIRKRTNYLLATLTLSNVASNTAFTLLTDSFIKSWYTMMVVTIVILIFGEMLPIAICTRHALIIGAKLNWLAYMLMYITFPLSYPSGKWLDKILGEDVTSYTRAQLKEVLEITSDVPKQERDIIAGALEMHTKKVEEVMTRIEDVYSISNKAYLDYTTIAEIIASGYSRIPIYEGDITNIIAIIFTKDLALLDPEDRIPVKTLLKLSRLENLYIEVGTTLDAVFNTFKEDPLKRHLALVYESIDDGNEVIKRVLGLVTMEDIIEELVQFEIVDEFDIIIDNRSKRKRDKSRVISQFMSAFARQFDNKADFINPQMRLATFQFLASAVDKFQPDVMAPKVLHRLLNQNVIFHVDPKIMPYANQIFDQEANGDSFVMVLEGRVEVLIGKEEIKCESGPFFYFGLSNLNTEIDLNAGTDYKVTPSGEVSYLKIPRDLYFAALRATECEKTGTLPDLLHEPYPELFYDEENIKDDYDGNFSKAGSSISRRF